MIQKKFLPLAFAAAILTVAVPAVAQNSTLKTAVFAGGCYWTVEKLFEQIPGVTKAVSGFTGGTTRNPTYEEVAYEHKGGHVEAVQVTYDPSKISYAKLVDHFWRMINPTVRNEQACDTGESYDARIFVANAEERRIAEASKKALDTGPRKGRIVTPIQNASAFWPGPEEHQDFYKKNPAGRYTQYDAGCGPDRRAAIAHWYGDLPPVK